MRSLFCGFLLVLSSFLPAASLASPLRVEGSRFIDRAGRQVILRGVNVSGASKLPPFQVIRAAKDLWPLRGWGFNTIRLLFNWEAFEPEKDRYDLGYLRYYLKVIRWAAFYDLYVIVDIHQDAFSRYTAKGCGEGFPKWTLPPDLIAAEPKNDEVCKAWFVSAIADKDMHAAWSAFYLNTGGVRDQYLALVRKLSHAIAHERNVIGIDLMNEPWGEEETELHALYEDAAKEVRQELSDTILFLSPVALTSLGLKVSTLPRIDDPNIVHAAHFYDPGLLTNSWSKGALEQTALTWKTILGEWQTPLFVGEFGASPSLPRAADYLDNIYDLLDQELYSGALWVYTPTWNPETKDGWNQEDLSISDDKGQLRGAYRPRPFVERTPGILVDMRWNRLLQNLSFSYQPRGFGGFFDLVIPRNFKLSGFGISDRNLACKKLDRDRLRCSTQRQHSDRLIKVSVWFKEKKI
ncbi:MAG: cellulase family glycosylhydrolase [Oligoflexus sp.]|nr:cellulase family glycosylhydrolase [Oligoflexus sp.]